MVVSEELLSIVSYFHVHNLLGSVAPDHCKLSMLLKARIKQTPISCDLNVIPMPVQYKWDETSIIRFQEALATIDIQTKIKYINGNKYGKSEKDITTAVCDIQDVLISAAEKSLKKTTRNKFIKHKSRVKSKAWFDKSLGQMRQQIDKKSALLSKYPNDPIIRGSYFKARKEYNRSRKFKQKKYREEILAKLDDMRADHPQEYWKLLKLLKDDSEQKGLANEIDIQDWFTYFKKMNEKVPREDSTISENITPLERSMTTSNQYLIMI
jgi:ribulose bisphosphate carboxylase small subunit